MAKLLPVNESAVTLRSRAGNIDAGEAFRVGVGALPKSDSVPLSRPALEQGFGSPANGGANGANGGAKWRGSLNVSKVWFTIAGFQNYATASVLGLLAIMISAGPALPQDDAVPEPT